ncbi:MAG: isopentenyl phosphate kinase [Candidatus Micrarchaeota archaeon]
MLIVKLGGSVVSKKHGYMEENEKAIESLTTVIANAWKAGKKDIVLVHGAGSFGHAPVIMHGIREGVKTIENKVSYADTHAGCSYLSLIIVNSLIKQGIPAISLPPAALIKQRDRRILSFEAKIVNDYLQNGYMPILYGDMVLDDKRGGAPCSGDQIVAHLGKNAKKIIFGTNVDGILLNGKVVDKVTKKNVKEILENVKGAATNDVTGGMEGKINEMIKLKKPIYIVNANYPERLEAVLRGKKTTCTEIRL